MDLQPLEMPASLQERQPATVHANDVVKVLKHLMEDLRFTMDSEGKSAPMFLAQYEKRNLELDTKYWESFLPASSEVIKEEIWDALMEALQKYALQMYRRKLTQKRINDLRSQNSELKHLLMNYMSSPTNQEYHVPPTHTIHSEYLSRLMAPASPLATYDESVGFDALLQEHNVAPERKAKPRLSFSAKKYKI